MKGLSEEMTIADAIRRWMGSKLPHQRTLPLCVDCATTNAAISAEFSSRFDLLLLFFLATYFLCDSTVEILAEQLIAPFWHRVGERRPALPPRSIGRRRSIKQWLCGPSRIEKNFRLFRSDQLSRKPPPLVLSLPTSS
jgi:hypothetical protein